MSLLPLLLLGLIVGANNLAAALALGALGQFSRRWRIILVFGLFEFFVPLLGITMGQSVALWIEQEVTWVGAGFLAVLGIWTIIAGLRQPAADETLAPKLTTWAGLMGLGAGLSIDNLIIGFSLGLGTVNALAVATTVCLCSVTFTWVGLRLGRVAGPERAPYVTITAGVLLLGLASAQVMQWF